MVCLTVVLTNETNDAGAVPIAASAATSDFVRIALADAGRALAGVRRRLAGVGRTPAGVLNALFPV